MKEGVMSVVFFPGSTQKAVLYQPDYLIKIENNNLIWYKNRQKLNFNLGYLKPSHRYITTSSTNPSINSTEFKNKH